MKKVLLIAVAGLTLIFVAIAILLYTADAAPFGQIIKVLGIIYSVILMAVVAKLSRFFSIPSFGRHTTARADMAYINAAMHSGELSEIICREFNIESTMIDRSLERELRIPLPEIEDVIETLGRRYDLPIDIDEVDSSTSVSKMVAIVESRLG